MKIVTDSNRIEFDMSKLERKRTNGENNEHQYFMWVQCDCARIKKKEEKQKQSDNWSKKQVNRLNSG